MPRVIPDNFASVLAEEGLLKSGAFDGWDAAGVAGAGTLAAGLLAFRRPKTLAKALWSPTRIFSPIKGGHATRAIGTGIVGSAAVGGALAGQRTGEVLERVGSRKLHPNAVMPHLKRMSEQ